MADIRHRTTGHKAVDAFPAIAFVVVVAMIVVVLLWN
jgi:hypothetical protein